MQSSSKMSVLVAALLLLLPAVASGAFDENLAKEKLYPLSAAAYSSEPQKCITNKLPGATLVRQVDAKCDVFNNNCSGFVAVSPADKAIILSFRGSNSPTQLLSLASVIGPRVIFIGGGAIGRYYYNAFSAPWNNGLFESFTKLAKENPTYKLWVTGHSMGAAMAAIAAGEISARNLFPKEKILLVTFGQPRTGNADFAKAFDSLVPESFRVTNRRDIVPHFPTSILPFASSLGLKYQHHSREIFYPNGMAEGAPFKTCAEFEDPTCSNGSPHFTAAENKEYYGKALPAYGVNGCI